LEYCGVGGHFSAEGLIMQKGHTLQRKLVFPSINWQSARRINTDAIVKEQTHSYTRLTYLPEMAFWSRNVE
jgi:hypothetical protein